MQPFNKYYGPDYDGKRSANAIAGVHALGKRAKRLKSEGILTVRFELPFTVVCSRCNEHIGQGVRFNAQKKRIGNYYSTPIWQFSFSCHICKNAIVVATDPKNTRYTVTEGASQRTETKDPRIEHLNETLTASDQSLKQSEDQNKNQSQIESSVCDTNNQYKPNLEEDIVSEQDLVFHQLEKQALDVQKKEKLAPVIDRLFERNERIWSDPYTMSQKVRGVFRAKKHAIERKEAQEEQLRDKIGFHMQLLDEVPDDAVAASKVDFGQTSLERSDSRIRAVRNAEIFNRSDSRKAANRSARIGASASETLCKNIHNMTSNRNEPFPNDFSRRYDRNLRHEISSAAHRNKNIKISSERDVAEDDTNPILVPYSSDDE